MNPSPPGHEVSGLHNDAGSSRLAPLMGRYLVARQLYRRAQVSRGTSLGENTDCHDCVQIVETEATIAVGTGGLARIVLGDASSSKLLPYYRAQEGVATILGLESIGMPPGELPGQEGALGAGTGVDVLVHVAVFDVRSVHELDFSLCLSPFVFGFVVFQESVPSAGQLAE